jgi:acetyl-CoA C-acetyltransferase
VELGLKPLARIVSWATAGVDPSIMGIGPVPATKVALKEANWKLDDVDLIEANEAFAAQSLAVSKEMSWDIEKVNINGGAIAMGHPLGATGTMILGTALDELERSNKNVALISLCVASGMGSSTIIERV